jgi:hypothetical protein
MDPNLFRIDWQQTGEVLIAIVVLAFLVERALALIFESTFYVDRISQYNIKELITFAVCFAICYRWELDGLSVILHGGKMTLIGEAMTAAVIAGGSKASLKLFRDVMGVENEQSKNARQANARASLERDHAREDKYR